MSNQALIFGEVLFDCFPDGQTVLGGAPFNVAWHLQGLGLPARFISRVGQDARGEQILAAMRDWGMDTAGVEADPDHPTGTVAVSLSNGDAGFEILAEQAYDYISAATVQRSLQNVVLCYHGSLIQRAPPARAALQVLQDSGIPIFTDINLRPPWWSAEAVHHSLQHSRWLKINHEELEILAQELGFGGDFPGQRALHLKAAYPNITQVIVTCGAEGAFVVDADNQVTTVQPAADIPIIDTVGAGDAFSAMSIAGLLLDWPMQTLLQRAQAFAGAVCGIRGATTGDKAFYSAHRRRS